MSFYKLDRRIAQALNGPLEALNNRNHADHDGMYPFRWRVITRLKRALEQIDGGTIPVALTQEEIDKCIELPPWKTDLSDGETVTLGEIPEEVDQYVTITERPFLDEDERIREGLLESEPADRQLFELLVQGKVRRIRGMPARRTWSDILKNNYLLLEDVRRRIAYLKLDESNPKRVLRISGAHNTVLRISHGDGTVVFDDETGEPGFWLRLIMFTVEDFADSTRGDPKDGAQ